MYLQGVFWGMNLWSRDSLGMNVWSRRPQGNEGIVKELTGERRFDSEGRWGMKLWSRVSLGNEGMVKGFAAE